MTDEFEDRLRRALAARAEIVSSTDLRPAAPPPAPPRSRGPYLVTGLALAAAAAAAGVFVLGGGLFPGGGDQTVAASGSTLVTTQATGGTATAAAATTPANATGSAIPTGVASPSPVSSSGQSTTAPASPAPSGATTSAAPCAASVISAYVLPDTQARPHGGGMNHQGATIGLTNTGSTTCRLTGYPGVAMLSGTTMISSDPNTRGSTYYAKDPGSATVVLPVGGSAFAELSWTSADGVQPAASVDTLQVILPDQRTKLSVPLSTTLGGDRTLTVTALTANPLPLNGSGG